MPRYLNPDEIDHFIHQGFVVARNAIPGDVVQASRKAMWDVIKMSEDDPSTWPDRSIGIYPEALEATLPCRTHSAVDAIVEQLVGPLFVRGTGFWPVLSFPRPQAGNREWRTWEAHPGEHIDGGSAKPLYPRDRMLVVLPYLTDTTEFGGPVAVRKGSPREIFEHFYRKRQFENIADIVPDFPLSMPLTPIPGNAGDVVFMHYLMCHSSSWNRDTHVRVALNGTAYVHSQYPYRPRVGGPTADWTPLDYSLRTDNL